MSQRLRLARALLAGTMLGGSVVASERAMAVQAQVACSGTQSIGGNGGTSSDGGPSGAGGCNTALGNSAPDGNSAQVTPGVAYFGGGGGGAGADQSGPAGNGGLGDGGATTGGAGGTTLGGSGGVGSPANTTSSGGGGGGGGYYGAVLRTSGLANVGSVAGGAGGAGGSSSLSGTGNGGGGGGGGGGAGLIVTVDGVTVTGLVQGGAGGTGGDAYLGVGGDGGRGGIGTIVVPTSGTLTLGAVGQTSQITGGTGGAGGPSSNSIPGVASGGRGGDGIVLPNGVSLAIAGGGTGQLTGIVGGTGGAAGLTSSYLGNSGDGGTGAALTGPNLTFSGGGSSIQGGLGGSQVIGGNGGSGVTFASGSLTISESSTGVTADTVQGGAGGAGSFGGVGGTGIVFSGSRLVVSGLIATSGGTGGTGSTGGVGMALANTSSLMLFGGASVTGGVGGPVNPGDVFGSGGAGISGGGTITVGASGETATTVVSGGQGGGSGAAGGPGIVGDNLSITTYGRIAGGLSGDPNPTTANAITFNSGINILMLGAGSSLLGNVEIDNGSLEFRQSDTAEVTDIASTSNNVTGAVGTTQITGSGSIAKTGAGTLILSGTNTYSGGTTIQGGILQVGAVPGTLVSQSLGSGAVTLDGGTLQAAPQFGAGAQSNIGFSLGNPIGIGAAGGTVSVNGNAFVLSGDITDGSTAPGTLTVSNTNTNGINTLTLSGAGNSFSGGLIVGDHTVVQLGATNAAGRGSLELDGSAGLDLGHHDQTITQLSGSGNIYNIGNLTANVSNTLTVQSGVFTGNIIDGGNGTFRGQVALTKVSDGSASGGTLTLSGALNQYDGPTAVSGGVLQAASSTGFSLYSDVMLATAGTLDLNGFDNGIKTLAGAGTVTNTGTAAATLTIGNQAFANASTSFGGAIQDGNAPLGLTKAGTGRLTLTATDTFSGFTTVNTGTLEIGAGGAITRSAALQNNATLQIDAGGSATFTGLATTAASLVDAGTLSARALVNRASATLTQTGTLNATTVSNAGSADLAGTLGVGTFDNTGVVTLSGTLGGATTTFDNRAAGTLAVGGNVFTGLTTLTNDGQVSLGTNGVVRATTLTNDAGGTLTSTGTLNLGALNNAGTAGLAGTLNATQVVNSAALSVTGAFGGSIGSVVQQAGAFDLGAQTVSIGALTLTGGTVRNGTLIANTFGVQAGSVSATLAGGGPLTKTGPGTVTLTGTSTYAGATDIQSGRFAVDGALGNTAVTVERDAVLGGSGMIAGAVTIADGGTLAPGNSPGTITLGSLTLTKGTKGSSGSILAYDLGTGSDRTVVAGNLVLAGTLNVTDSGGFAPGSYRIFDYGGTLTDQTLAIGALPGTQPGAIQTAIANQVNLVVTAPSTTVQFWNGPNAAATGTITGGTGPWTNAITNWTDTTATQDIAWAGGVAVFAGTAGTVSVADTLAFQGLQFTTDGYVVAGGTGGTLMPTLQASNIRVGSGLVATIGATITGTGGLSKDGGGTLVIAAADTYAGGTTIAAGTLQIGAGGTNGSIAGDVVDNATLAFNRSDAVTVSGAVSGTGTLVQQGTGRLILAGTNSYSGGTTVSEGTLQIGNGGTAGSITGDVVDNAALVFARSDALTVAGMISGSGSLTQAGGGTLTLTAANSYAGATTIASGTLALRGAGGIAGSSALVNHGTFDISGSDAGAMLASLGGSGAVTLGAKTLTLTRAADTYAGPIGGTGGLVLQGGTETLTGANTYQGGTTIAGGTLGVGGNRALGTGAVTLDAGTTLKVAADRLTVGNTVRLTGTATIDTSDYTLASTGTISGVGALVKAGGGTLALSGANRYSGGTHLAAGTLALSRSGGLGTGRLAMDENTTLLFSRSLTLGNDIRFTGTTDPTIDTGSHDATLSGIISGPGALTKQGSGTLTLTGTSTYTGSTDVVQGTLEVDGSIASSTAAVGYGATLSGTGSVGGLTARAGSTVAPGTQANPYGTLAVSGSASFASSAIYRVSIDATGRSSSLAVTGAATLNHAALIVSSAQSTYNLATRYTILKASGGVQGVFGTLSTAQALAFLNPYLSYGADDVTLAFRRNGASVSSIAATPNQRSVASAIQSLDPNGAIARSVQGLSSDAARRALDALAGAPHADATVTATQDARRVATQILDRLWNIGGGEIDARTLLQQMETPNELPAFVNCFAPLPGKPSVAQPTIYTGWGEVFGDFGHDGADRNGAGLDRSLGGFILGYDAPIHGLGAPYRIGIAGGYTNNSFTATASSGPGATGTFESVFGSIYGGARYGAVEIRAGATAAGDSTTVNRSVGYPGYLEGEHSNYGGSTEQVFGEVGYRFSGTRWVIEPVANAAYTHVHQDGFREKGGAGALLGFAEDSDVGTTTLGARGEMAPSVGLPLVARAFLGWRHAFGDTNPATRLAFEADPIPFMSQGAAIDRDALAIEAGLDWRYSGAITVGVAYIGQVGARDRDNGVKGRMEYRF